ncbi:hypothetical protein Pelo_15347 [Pelomyxa schiedti]|nr:hypothetical protein Pelo_15347 [Pelomyxa schiedti]
MSLGGSGNRSANDPYAEALSVAAASCAASYTGESLRSLSESSSPTPKQRGGSLLRRFLGGNGSGGACEDPTIPTSSSGSESNRHDDEEEEEEAEGAACHTPVSPANSATTGGVGSLPPHPLTPAPTPPPSTSSRTPSHPTPTPTPTPTQNSNVNGNENTPATASVHVTVITTPTSIPTTSSLPTPSQPIAPVATVNLSANTGAPNLPSKDTGLSELPEANCTPALNSPPPVSLAPITLSHTPTATSCTASSLNSLPLAPDHSQNTKVSPPKWMLSRTGAVAENPYLGSLKLPELEDSDSYEYTENGCKFVARFGNMFEPPKPGQGTAVMIPGYHDGILFMKALQMDPHLAMKLPSTEFQLQEKTRVGVVVVPAYIEAIPDITHWVLFQYEVMSPKYRMAEVFLEAVGKINGNKPPAAWHKPTTTILRVPAFGTNNNVSFFDTACLISYSGQEFVQGIAQTLDPIRTLELLIMKGQPSSRVLAHTGMCLNFLSTASTSADLCSVCENRNRAIVLKQCGHRVMCLVCCRKLLASSSSPECPVCRTVYTLTDMLFVPHLNLMDAAPCAVCGALGNRDNAIFLPCGHCDAVCIKASCIDRAKQSKVCLVCGSFAEYRKIYLS